MDIGARGIGMGGAYTAVSDDAYSLYWNPAGLARIPRVSAQFMYSPYAADISYQSASYAQRVNDTIVVGGGWRYQDFGNIDRTDVNDQTLGTFHPRSYVVEAGWGQSIYDLSDSDADLAVGVAARWIHTDMVLNSDAYSGDVGVQARMYTPSNHYDLGASFQNMGRGQKFDKIRDTPPFRARVGAAFYPLPGLTVALDGIVPINNVPHGALGVEYGLSVPYGVKTMLRAGFNSLTLQSLTPWASMSMGMGVKMRNITVDYAFTPFGILGTADVHRVSVSLNLPSRATRKFRERSR